LLLRLINRKNNNTYLKKELQKLTGKSRTSTPPEAGKISNQNTKMTIFEL